MSVLKNLRSLSEMEFYKNAWRIRKELTLWMIKDFGLSRKPRSVEREQVEVELRVLHSQLDASSSEYGDYNMCKAVEKLIIALSKDCSLDTLQEWVNETSVKLEERINERESIRQRIVELESEL